MSGELESIMVSATENFSPVSCEYCNKCFTFHANLYRHIQQIHKVAVNINKGTLKCPLCTEKTFNNALLRAQVSSVHNKKIESEICDFANFSEFTSWKSELERENNARYVQERAPKQLSSNQQKMSFCCHRTGFLKVKD